MGYIPKVNKSEEWLHPIPHTFLRWRKAFAALIIALNLVSIRLLKIFFSCYVWAVADYVQWLGDILPQAVDPAEFLTGESGKNASCGY